jgi:hypothetical protein
MNLKRYYSNICYEGNIFLRLGKNIKNKFVHFKILFEKKLIRKTKRAVKHSPFLKKIATYQSVYVTSKPFSNSLKILVTYKLLNYCNFYNHSGNHGKILNSFIPLRLYFLFLVIYFE